MEKIYLTYNQIHLQCSHLVESILREHDDAPTVEPTLIVGLARGGCVPAVIMSHLMGIPVTMLAYSSHKGLGDNKEALNQIPNELLDYTGRILLVDDICDSGYTLKEVHDTLTDHGCIVDSVTIVTRSNSASGFSPTWTGLIVDNDSWIVFPWEEPDWKTCEKLTERHLPLY